MGKEQQPQVKKDHPHLGEQPLARGEVTSLVGSHDPLQGMVAQEEQGQEADHGHGQTNGHGPTPQPLPVQILQEIPLVEKEKERQGDADLLAAHGKHPGHEAAGKVETAGLFGKT